jgi:hypothetical protein
MAATYLTEIERLLTLAKAENTKLEGGCKASAPKVRNSLLDIAKQCAESRKVVLDIGKAIEVKHRVKPAEPAEQKPAEPDDLPLAPPKLERQSAQSSEPATAAAVAPEPVKKLRAARKPKEAKAA